MGTNGKRKRKMVGLAESVLKRVGISVLAEANRWRIARNLTPLNIK